MCIIDIKMVPLYILKLLYMYNFVLVFFHSFIFVTNIYLLYLLKYMHTFIQHFQWGSQLTDKKDVEIDKI